MSAYTPNLITEIKKQTTEKKKKTRRLSFQVFSDTFKLHGKTA